MGAEGAERKRRPNEAVTSAGAAFFTARARSGASEQVDILLVEFFFVEVLLNFYQLFAHAGLLARGPREGVTIAGTVTQCLTSI